MFGNARNKKDCIESLIIVLDSELKRLKHEKLNISTKSFIPKTEIEKLFDNKIIITKRFKDVLEKSENVKEDIKKFNNDDFDSVIESINFFLKQMKTLSKADDDKHSTDETVKLIQKYKKQVISLYKK